jgi:hypothetical protein
MRQTSGSTKIIREDDKQNTESTVFNKKEGSKMSGLVFKGELKGLAWEPIISTKVFKDKIDPVTNQPHQQTKIVGFIHRGQDTRNLIIASLDDGVTQTAGTGAIRLDLVYPWLVDSLLAVNGTPTIHGTRLYSVSESSLAKVMSAR